MQKGASPIPETPLEIRKNIAEKLQEQGLSTLYQELTQIDKDTADRLSANDTTRIRRALEVWYHTKKNMTYWQSVPLKKFYDDENFINILYTFLFALFSISISHEFKLLNDSLSVISYTTRIPFPPL